MLVPSASQSALFISYAGLLHYFLLLTNAEIFYQHKKILCKINMQDFSHTKIGIQADTTHTHTDTHTH